MLIPLPVRARCRAPACAVIGTLLAVSVLPAAAQPLYVDADAIGPVHDGTSWCTAFRELYEALAIASFDAEIRIADGRYLPDAAGLPDPRAATFRLELPVTLAGGYAGCGAPDPDAHDPEVYPTILSGDLAGDDVHGLVGDNVYHVVTIGGMSSGVTLSGLRIVGGNGLPDADGGGIINLVGIPVALHRCRLEGNQARRGGAVYQESGSLLLHHCHLRGNTTSWEGGAIYDWSVQVELSNCLFAGNVAQSDGGAIFSDLSEVDAVNCTFSGNESAWRGGAFYNYVGVGLEIGNCILWANSDQTGSGETAQVFNNPSNLVTIDHSCVQGWTGSFGGTGNIGDDPQFVDPLVGDFTLASTSPCRDTGENAFVTVELDLAGLPRIVDEIVDMGAFEYQGSTGVSDGELAGERGIGPRIIAIQPNPVQADCRVAFESPVAADLTVTVYDLAGRRVRRFFTGAPGPGIHHAYWDGHDTTGRPVGAGVYLLALEQRGRQTDFRKLICVR